MYKEFQKNKFSRLRERQLSTIAPQALATSRLFLPSGTEAIKPNHQRGQAVNYSQQDQLIATQ